VSYALEGLEDRGKGVALVGMALNGDQNIQWTVIINDAQASDLRTYRVTSITGWGHCHQQCQKVVEAFAD
jgi:hypothetical protein